MEHGGDIAIAISACSLFVSYLTWRQKNSETRRTIRSQITDAISKLDSVFAEWDKLIHENLDKSSDPYLVARRSFLNGQRRFLARQVVFLIDQVPELTTDFEYNRVADAFSAVGDFDKANHYYLKAMEVSENNYYKSICARAYARSLFWQGSPTDARERYQESVALVKQDSDFYRFHTAETYQRWAAAEADAGNWDEAKMRLEDARRIYEIIKNKRLKLQGLENLGRVEKDLDMRLQ